MKEVDEQTLTDDGITLTDAIAQWLNGASPEDIERNKRYVDGFRGVKDALRAGYVLINPKKVDKLQTYLIAEGDEEKMVERQLLTAKVASL